MFICGSGAGAKEVADTLIRELGWQPTIACSRAGLSSTMLTCA